MSERPLPPLVAYSPLCALCQGSVVVSEVSTYRVVTLDPVIETKKPACEPKSDEIRIESILNATRVHYDSRAFVDLVHFCCMIYLKALRSPLSLHEWLRFLSPSLSQNIHWDRISHLDYSPLVSQSKISYQQIQAQDRFERLPAEVRQMIVSYLPGWRILQLAVPELAQESKALSKSCKHQIRNTDPARRRLMTATLVSQALPERLKYNHKTITLAKVMWIQYIKIDETDYVRDIMDSYVEEKGCFIKQMPGPNTVPHVIYAVGEFGITDVAFSVDEKDGPIWGLNSGGKTNLGGGILDAISAGAIQLGYDVSAASSAIVLSVYLIRRGKGFKCRAIDAASGSREGIVASVVPVFSHDDFPGCNRKVIRPLENSSSASVGGLVFRRYQRADIIIFNGKNFLRISVNDASGFQSLSAQDCGGTGHVALQETNTVKVHILGLSSSHTYLHVHVRA